MLNKKQSRGTRQPPAAQWSKVQQHRIAHAEQVADEKNGLPSVTGVPMRQLILQVWSLYGLLIGRKFVPAPDLDLTNGEEYKKVGFDLHQQIIQLTIALECINQQSLW